MLFLEIVVNGVGQLLAHVQHVRVFHPASGGGGVAAAAQSLQDHLHVYLAQRTGRHVYAVVLPVQHKGGPDTPDGQQLVGRLGGGHAVDLLFNRGHGDVAVHELGVTDVVGVTSVGTCDYTYRLGSLCLITDFLDFTRSRPASFEREHRQSLHTGMEDVFSPRLNDTLERMILARGLPYSGRTIYACTEGPRFETAAEVRMLRMLGAQVIGMTIVPEAPLCRDLGLSYTAIGIVANYCTGMTGEVTDQGIDEVMAQRRDDVFDLCFDLIRSADGT